MPNDKAQKPNSPSPKYDLEERTALFGEAIIKFVGSLPHAPTILPLVSQVIRSATSVGANELALIFSAIIRK